jgi:hypothetical protein
MTNQRLYRELQYCCPLAYTKMREQHDLTIGELKCIVVRAWVIVIDLPEPSHLMLECRLTPLEENKLEPRGAHVPLHFQSRHQCQGEGTRPHWALRPRKIHMSLCCRIALSLTYRQPLRVWTRHHVSYSRT